MSEEHNLKIDDVVVVIDSDLGRVNGPVIGFTHENYPIVQFTSATVEIFPEDIVMVYFAQGD